MPATFQNLGVSFQYPDNWSLDDSDARLGRKSVAVYSPGGAFWSVAVRKGSQIPVESASEVVEAMKLEYPGLECVEAEEVVGGRSLAGYDLAFFCMDLTNSARVRSFRVDRTTYTVFFQAEDREYERLERVFSAITASLLMSLRNGEESLPHRE